MPEEGALGPPEAVKQKIGPLPVWLWVVAGAGIIGLVLYMKKSGTAQPSAVGDLAGVGAGVGVGSTDPLTSQQLLQSIQDLTNALKAQNPPQPSSIPSTSGEWGTFIHPEPPKRVSWAELARQTAPPPNQSPSLSPVQQMPRWPGTGSGVDAARTAISYPSSPP